MKEIKINVKGVLVFGVFIKYQFNDFVYEIVHRNIIFNSNTHYVVYRKLNLGTYENFCKTLPPSRIFL